MATTASIFTSYAFPPNELGYCGPADISAGELNSRAREFDGAWPYLRAIADAVGAADPLDAEVVLNYWVGGPLLDRVEPTALLDRLRCAFDGQVTGLLDELDDSAHPLAHHSFHVFVVYPWVRFLDRDPATPLRVLQSCRIRWGTVEEVCGDHAVITSTPLEFGPGGLALAESAPERVRWSRDGTALAPAPTPGALVAAHWDWVCGTLTQTQAAALEEATRRTLDLVNSTREQPQKRPKTP